MICVNCNIKLKCSETYTPEHYDYTYRRMICPKCRDIIYTEEKKCGTNLGRKMFNEKRKLYKSTENNL